MVSLRFRNPGRGGRLLGTAETVCGTGPPRVCKSHSALDSSAFLYSAANTCGLVPSLRSDFSGQLSFGVLGCGRHPCPLSSHCAVTSAFAGGRPVPRPFLSRVVRIVKILGRIPTPDGVPALKEPWCLGFTVLPSSPKDTRFHWRFLNVWETRFQTQNSVPIALSRSEQKFQLPDQILKGQFPLSSALSITCFPCYISFLFLYQGSNSGPCTYAGELNPRPLCYISKHSIFLFCSPSIGRCFLRHLFSVNIPDKRKVEGDHYPL